MAILPNVYVRNNMGLISGGYPGEAIGINEGTYAEWTPCPDSGSAYSEYYYTDSNVSSNSNSSRVTFKIRDTWTASLTSENTLTVRVTSVIESIVRGNVVGGATGASTRHIMLKRDASSPNIWEVTNNPINVAQTLGTNITVSAYTFTIPAQSGISRGTIYIKNAVTGHESDPVPSIYVDELWGGVAFKNDNVKDYVPGQVLDNNNVWQSHNRSTGNAQIRNAAGQWIQMRTNNGAVGTDNPPYIRHNDNWKNMRKIGANG